MSWSKIFEPYMHQRLQSWRKQISGWLLGIRTGEKRDGWTADSEGS